jgi:hypothetical protein
MFEATTRRAKGYAVWSGPDGRPVERDTLQCVHCQAHWFVEPGSGRRRGFCTRCMGPTCGAAKCDPCAPFLKQLEAMEARNRFAQAAGLVQR